MYQNIKKHITEILRSMHKGKNIEFFDETNLFEVGVLNSFSVLTYIELLEDKFNFKFSASELTPQNLWSISAVSIVIENNLQLKQGC